jgi:HEAT repeat protein
MPLFGPPDVKKLEAKRDILGLIEALGYDKDPKLAADVRYDAAEALGLIGDRRAIEPLLAVLWDQNLNVRRIAAEALGRFREERTVDPLIDLLKAHLPYDDEPYVRVCQEAIRSLGRLGDWRAVEPLLNVFGSANEDLRREAADALDKIGWRPDTGQAGASYWAARHDWLKCIDIGGPAVVPLCALLTTADATTRLRAVETLGEIGDRRAVPTLAQCLRDWRFTRRETIVQALAKITDPSAIDALIEGLSNQEVRPAAIKALAEVGEPAVRPLMGLLKNPDPEVVNAAAEALEAMGPVATEILNSYLDELGRRAGGASRQSLGS